jgi:hypothetical protein
MFISARENMKVALHRRKAFFYQNRKFYVWVRVEQTEERV